MEQKSNIKFSVVIPAYDEAEFVGDSIRSLQNQTVGRNKFEIIVVDNNSKDDTLKQALKAGADKVILEKRQGSNFARERGFKESSGEIVAFLDADSLPFPNWLERIESGLNRKNVAAVSGPFDYGYTGFKKVLDTIYSKKLLPAAPKLLHFLFSKKAGVLIGGNFALKRTVFDKIGGFPPLTFWGDDAAIAMLISRKAGQVFYDTNLIVESSPRRFEHQGIFRTIPKYMLEYLKAYFKNY